uniref:Putative E3 ubiquitin-protein ligase LIN-2 n=1 Tax=Lotus japonicus TaxID=34305 RepID=LIN2_LOTJA|nr:RecName: Full=Putative E3 ubiquitin-protein ligase LIN-2; Short=LjLIN; AltName: Full=RING-type E3 ubiquitin transferase LIN-2 [Lotus japonicus]ACL14423.1 putative E3 ubiquitin ligase [Lotus japonicus]
MAGNFRFMMDQKDIVRFLTTTVDSFIQDRLINKEQRTQHKEQCAERLAAEDGSGDKDTEVEYSDQAVLANLDWGIEALEEAINTYNMETKLARLDYAEKMLQVCAMLNPKQKIAGVPNSYLSAWAHLNLSYLWKLRNNVQNCISHALEMFIVDPFFTRIDFAPELWKSLFLPHMSSIVGWYSEERHRLMMEVIPDSADLSFTADFEQFFNESLVLTMRPHQLEKLQKLEQLYGESLDENTKLYAKYYNDCMNSDSSSSKKAVPMLPIAEPPMTPLHELSRTIPDFVKFGPILPKSAGFSLAPRSKDVLNETIRENVTSSNLKEEKLSIWGAKDTIIEENEDDSDSELDNESVDSDDKNNIFSPGMKMMKYEGVETKVDLSCQRNQIPSPDIFSPLDSPRTAPNNSSPNPDMHSKRDSKFLRLSSSRIREPTISDSLTSSPDISIDNISNADNEVMVRNNIKRKNDSQTPSMNQDNENSLVLNDSSHCESEDGYQSSSSLPKLEKLSMGSKPPKDFVCPITGQIFCDPVTLETGQTYERKAIQEWLRTGNTTCPITRQPLSASILPKTNYVLKRLITSWKEQNPELAQEFSNVNTPRGSSCSPSAKDIPMLSTRQRTTDSPNHKNKDYARQRSNRFMPAAITTSPTSVLSQAAVETIVNSLKPYISSLCTSENLPECEEAVLKIARLLKDSKTNPQIHSYLSKPTIINGLVEILSASRNREVLRTSIYILSELIFTDDSVAETLNSVDSDFDCLATLLKNGLAEAALLIYQLRPVFAQLSAHELIPSLVDVIQNKNEELDDFQLVIDPKDAAIAILEQTLMGGDEYSRSLNASSVISANGIPTLVKYLERMEGRRSVVSVLLCCMQAEKSCKNLIANRIELSPVLELFHSGNDSVRGTCVEFLSELVQLNRRTSCNQLLHTIKDEGAFSTMHTFLVYLQMAPMEHQLAVASLLLQLDLLAEPRKMSIYREEAVETLIEALWQKDFSNTQMKALDALLFLIGHISSSGKSYTEAWLLKIAGFDQPYNALMKVEQLGQHDNDLIETMEDEKNALNSWQKRIASVLCNHENGSIFKALEECLKSNSLKMAKSCLVLATWLTRMLYTLPDTGVRDVARKSLLEEVIKVLHSSKSLEDMILVTLSLYPFISDPTVHEVLRVYAKSIYRILRKLKKYSTVAADILKALLNLNSVDVTELWSCKEVVELDLSSNGEVLSLHYLNGQVLSGLMDGTSKVCDARKRIPRVIQETHEHTKAVTSLCSSGDRLYSASLDKTIRVWTIKSDGIKCIDVYDIKEAVHELAANDKLACYVSQGTGVKVFNWSEAPKLINFSKYVKSLAVAGDKLYCGCSGYSIQEVDLSTYTSNSFFTGTRKLLGKQTIHSLQIHDDYLFACVSSVDATAGKIFSLSQKMVVGSLSTGLDIHRIAINSDFIFAGTKFGTIEVWLKDKFTRVASIQMAGGHTKITSLVSDVDGMMLFVGSSDGKIQVWALD